MNGLSGCKSVDLMTLMEQMEVMQDELEEKDQTIQSMKGELAGLPTLSEWQNVRETMQRQSMQLQEQSLKLRKQAEHIARQNGSDRILKDNEKLKSENMDLTAKTKDALYAKEQAEKESAYAKSHMRIKEVEVEKKVLCEKCKNCKRAALDNAIKAYNERKKYLNDYLIVFVVFSIVTMILTVFRQKAFWNDTKEFFISFWNGAAKAVKAIYYAEGMIAGIAAEFIKADIWQSAAYWILLVLLIVITGTFIYLSVRFLWERWIEKIKTGINSWNVSAAILFLMIVVYLGDYIRLLIPVNLFLLWIIGVVLLIAVGIYFAGCGRYRY